MNKEVTIFSSTNAEFNKLQEEAINNLFKSKTPIKHIRQRPIQGGGEANYVNTYYMTQQASLITGFRWESECLEERAIPDWENPIEIGCKMRVTIYDSKGNAYRHTSWGQKEVGRYKKEHPKAGEAMSIFDDLKAAYSDGIKKALSYFGIANDIYGGREINYFDDDVELNVNDAKRAFNKYIEDSGLSWDKVFEICDIKSFTEITDFKEAYLKVKEYNEGGDST